MQVLPQSESNSRSERRRRRRARRGSRREPIGTALLGLTLVGSALVFGAQLSSAIVLFSLTAAAAALLLAPSRAPHMVRLLWVLAAYTLLQLVPMPLGWIGTLSPASAAVWRGVFTPLHAVPKYATLSVDPAATLLEALKLSGYVCIALAAAGLRARGRADRLAALAFGSALVVCLVTLAHGLLDIPLVYGRYAPHEMWRWTRGPFINGNNLAGYLNLGLFAGAGLWLLHRADPRARWAGVLLPLLATGTLISGSRGGVVALALGAVAFALLALRQNPGMRAPVATALGIAATATVVLSVAAGGNRVWEVAMSADMDTKVSVWLRSLALIRDFPVFGAGRGAFETAFSPYRELTGKGNLTLLYAQVENFPLAWLADYGLPGGVALLALGFVARRPVRRALRDPIAAGATVGLLVLVLQNFADFGLELFAVVAAALVVFASTDDAIEAPAERLPRVALPGALAVVVLSAAVTAWGANPPQLDRKRMRDSYASLRAPAAPDARAFDAELRGLMLRHPGDAYFPHLAGLRAVSLGRDPLPWFARALERSPLDATVHLSLADALEKRGAKGQATLHRRLAAVYDSVLRYRALDLIAPQMSSRAELVAAFPAGLPGGEFLEKLCTRVQPALVVDCWREVNQRDPTPARQLALASALLEAIEKGSTPCEPARKQACEAEATRLLDQNAAGATGARVAEIRAQLLSVRGEPAQAAKLLLEHCLPGRDGLPCYERALSLAITAKDPAALGVVSDRYAAVACGEPAECAALHERVGRAYLELSSPGLALRQFTTAATNVPDAEHWLLAAEAAARAGTSTTARRALSLLKREPMTAAQNARALAVEQALAAPGPSD